MIDRKARLQALADEGQPQMWFREKPPLVKTFVGSQTKVEATYNEWAKTANVDVVWFDHTWVGGYETAGLHGERTLHVGALPSVWGGGGSGFALLSLAVFYRVRPGPRAKATAKGETHGEEV